MTDEYINKLLSAVLITLAAVIILLWLIGIWTNEMRFGGTGVVLLIPTIVVGVTLMIRHDL